MFLDEMFHPRIAEELSTRGRDCVAVVADAALRRSSDQNLLQLAATRRPMTRHGVHILDRCGPRAHADRWFLPAGGVRAS
jgi:hypothetical protein